LNQQLAIQTREIADLKKQMQLLYQRVEASDLSEGIAAFDPMSNKPPHY
jgi:SlyX protein